MSAVDTGPKGINIETAGSSLVYEGERVDELEYKGLRLIQSPASFCFGTDSVLLAHFAAEGMKKAAKGSRAVDIGAGTGVLSLLIGARTGVSFTAVEIDEEQCSRLRRSLMLNSIGEERCRVVCGDALGRIDIEKNFDYAVSNPPYFKKGAGGLSRNASATHELSADIAGFAKAAARLLKYGGKLFMCYPAERLAEAFAALCANGLEPKTLRLVQTNAGARPYLALIKAMRGAKSGLIVENNLVIFDKPGEYTREVRGYYDER